MDAATLHDQHRILFADMRDLYEGLSLEPLPAETLAEQARDLALSLRKHFAEERRTLYGPLLVSADPTTRALAQICRAEADASETALDAFVRHWTVALHISRDPKGFRQEVRALFARVGKRVGLEERELAPRLGAA